MNRVLRGSLGVIAIGAMVAVSGCSSDAPQAQSASHQSADARSEPVDTPTSWGPMTSEVERAQEIVAGYTPAELAGQLIVGRYHGTDPGQVRALVRRGHLAGVSITSDNVVDEQQVRAMTSAVAEASRASGRDFPPVIGVDQEGGLVSHLRGVATEFPPYAAAGDAIEQDRKLGRSTVRRAAASTGLELRDLGFTWVFAPVADVTIGVADPTIGSRSPSSDPKVGAAATRGAVTGFQRAGIVSTTKHFPGHGTATTDSHDSLPIVTSSLPALSKRDLTPFRTAIDAGAGAIMIGHLDVQAIAPGGPSSLQPEIYSYLRDELGFEGVAITDSMGMGAVGGIRSSGVKAINAGADLLLMPVDADQAHRNMTAALKDGRLSRARAEEAATRVVALQMWQQRVASTVPVPDDVGERAAEAAARLESPAGR